MKKYALAVLVLMVAVTLFGCGKKESSITVTAPDGQAATVEVK